MTLKNHHARRYPCDDTKTLALAARSKENEAKVKVAVFDTHHYDRPVLEQANHQNHELIFLESCLSVVTADLAKGCRVVSCFANDRVDREVIEKLKSLNVDLLTIRGAGFNNIDLRAANENGLAVMRVPAYSPHAIAEHAVALLLTLNRKTHHAFNRVRDLNFSLEGLVGFDLIGKTVGVIGTGRIGQAFASIMRGFGCTVLVMDVKPDRPWALSCGAQYVELQELYERSDVISLHAPLNDSTKHLIGDAAFQRMKRNVVLINTSRGALIETSSLLKALKQKQIAGACLDVYEEEDGIFAQDLSENGIDDDLLARLITFPNVLITAHQAFLTHEALANIAQTTFENINAFVTNQASLNRLTDA